jgi:RNA polymerase sigma factor for flagellar operon FliA
VKHFTAEQIDEHIVAYTGNVDRMARYIVRKVPKSIDVQDLIQAGMVGLLEATSRFDTEIGVPFYGYATNRIYGAMLDELRREDWADRGARRVSTLISKAERTVERRKKGAATAIEVAKELDISLDAYFRMLSSMRTPVNMIPDDAFVNLVDNAILPFDQVARIQFGKAFDIALSRLTDREKYLLQLHYDDDLQFKDIAVLMNVNYSRISQIHKEIVTKLRNDLKLFVKGDATSFI